MEGDTKMPSGKKRNSSGMTTQARVKSLMLSSMLVPVIFAAPAAHAQNATANDDEGTLEEIVVQGIRSTIQNSIEIKRQSDIIVDALSADDIGDLPALSIGEALETLTGASSHREQGGATEISIRGLGPFLGSTVFNGREATNGSGDRSVNFSQFPSELFSAVKIYKTQQASLIEGGVSGQIALETVKPLEYGKQRIQFDLKGNYNPDNNDINIRERDFGFRGTFSYVDQYDLGDLGKLGISIGGQRNVTTNPEQEARSSSGFRDCRFDPNSPDAGVFSSGNCDSGDGDLDLEVDPATGTAPDAGVPFLLTASSRSYRQNITDDDRDAVFGALQWQPNNRLEINFDIAYSDRVFTEVRNDLVFAENRRIDAPDVPLDERLPFDLIVGDNGSLFSFTNEQRIETNSTYHERLEEYLGGGLAVSYQVNDRLNISIDASYSDTSRRENIIQTRLQSEPVDIFGNAVPGAANNGRVETATVIGGGDSIIPIFTVQNFDVTNADLFADAARTRIDLNQFRNNTIKAIRGDFDYETELGMINSVQGGVRFSQLEFDSVPRARDTFNHSDDAIQAASLACRNSVFPESGFLSAARGGQNLITNVDENGNVIAQGTGNAYASFDPLCLVEQFLGSVPDIPAPRDAIQNVDVEENTFAAYLQANYAGEVGDYPVRGNFGLRVVNTEVNSTGLRGELTAVLDGDGNIESIESDEDTLVPVEGGGSYTEFLPSFNAVVDLDDDVIMRAGIYRALSRPDPSDLGFGRDFSGIDNDAGSPSNIADAVGLAVANGNPFLGPLTSWNFDLAFEWYPNADTILAIGGYYKSFQGGFENVAQVEQFEVDGQSLETIVATQQVSDDTSTIYGVEITASHAFTYLPGLLSGLGAKVSYNYADSNFEFEDAQFGSASIISGGETVQRVGIVDPADIFGFSKHVASAQLYYQGGGFSAQAIYKYRSEYFQQFISTPGNLRYVGNTGVFEARISYRINDHVKVSLEAINIFDEPRRQFNPNRDNVAEVNVYGPRIFAGVQFRY